MLIDIKLTALSDSMEKGTLARWRVKPGDAVRRGDVIAEIETDKAMMELEAECDGTVARLLVAEGTSDVPVGQLLATLAPPGTIVDEAPQPTTAEVPQASEATAALSLPGRIRASPLARRLAREQGVDLAGVSGSGPSGRITKDDLPTSQLPSTMQAPHVAVKLSTMRRTIAERMATSRRTIPTFSLSIDVQLDALLALRTQLNAATVTKVSVNDFLIKALAGALIEVPDAHVQFAGDSLLRFSRADIAVAVQVPGGLVTPVIRDANALAVRDISTRMRQFASRARAGRLRPEEYEGGTASLSNLGMFGVTAFEAIVNPPQALIFAIGAAEQRAVVVDDRVSIATLMTVTGSFDHRAIDGATGAALLNALKHGLEMPAALTT